MPCTLCTGEIHSIEEITGVKLIEALGALKLMSCGPAYVMADVANTAKDHTHEYTVTATR